MNDVPRERPPEEEMWAGPSGQRWLANADGFEASIRPIGVELLARARLTPGERIIDVGCGAGGMSLDAAARVAPGGSITGLDISPDLINECTRRAAAKRPTVPARFVCADAAKSGLPPGQADCILSRFGIMFFTDPYGAFAHLHGLIRPGGRMAIAHWAPLKQNPWMLEVRAILAAHFDLPVVPPRTPGPFAFDAPDYLRDILGKAGFRGIDCVLWETNMFVGGPGSDPQQAAEFLMHALSMAQRALDAPVDVRQRVRAQLGKRLQDFHTPEGVCMPAAVWMTTAQA